MEIDYQNEYHCLAVGKKIENYNSRIEYILGFMEFLSEKNCNENNQRIFDSFLSKGNRLEIYKNYFLNIENLKCENMKIMMESESNMDLMKIENFNLEKGYGVYWNKEFFGFFIDKDDSENYLWELWEIKGNADITKMDEKELQNEKNFIIGIEKLKMDGYGIFRDGKIIEFYLDKIFAENRFEDFFGSEYDPE